LILLTLFQQLINLVLFGIMILSIVAVAALIAFISGLLADKLRCK